jgi:hypothetical protein
MDYLETVNHPFFRAANSVVHMAIKWLMNMGMTKDEARHWVQSWASGAGDGAN